MGAEYKPDEFLQGASNIDALFAEIDMPIVHLAETVARRHLEIVPGTAPEPRTHEQQASAYFGASLFPSPLKPAS